VAVLRQVPIAEQVTSELHSRIIEGVYAPGERLPSECDLADELGVSRGSVRSAMASLATAGLIDRRQGDGTYVRYVRGVENSLLHAIWEFSHLIKTGGSEPSIRPIDIARRPATEKEAAALNIGPGEQVISVVRLFFADNQPLIFSINVSPTSIFTVPFEELDAGLGLHGFLRCFCNEEVARLDMDISAIAAPATVQEALALEPETPILRLDQLFFNIHRRPLTLAINYYCGHNLSLYDVRPWSPWCRV